MMAEDRASIIEARRAARSSGATDERAGPDSTGPELPEVEQHLVKPTEPGIGRVVANVPCTNHKPAGFVRHVTIDVSGTPLAGRFIPGQSFGVLPPGVDNRGKPHKPRLYSVSSPTRGEQPDGAFDAELTASGSNGNIISTTVKRTIDEHWDTGELFLGVASNFLCDAKPGDEIRVTGPAGKRFILPARPDEHDYVFIATGTGIAPFRGMIIDLLSSGSNSTIVLVMGTPYATDLLYHAYFERLAAEHANFHYLTAISRERLQLDGHPGRMYVQDRLNADWGLIGPLLEVSGGPAQERARGLVYMCGIAGMELGVLSTLWSRLSPDARSVYIEVDEDSQDPAGWTRRMIRRQVRPTRQVFMEVY